MVSQSARFSASLTTPRVSDPGARTKGMGNRPMTSSMESLRFVFAEGADCHKSKEKSSGAPLQELASVRSLFFAKPGRSLGGVEKPLTSQAQLLDPAHPADAQFVENVLWEDSHVVFVTLNMLGSNNDTLPWTGNFIDPAAQAKEVAERTDADIRWLQAAFARAQARHAKAVVIGLQADIWDPAAVAPGAEGLYAYTPFVRKLAALSTQFRKPVLLLNGDSHGYGAGRPLADPLGATGKIHGTAPVPNLLRITVQGSTKAPRTAGRGATGAARAAPLAAPPGAATGPVPATRA